MDNLRRQMQVFRSRLIPPAIANPFQRNEPYDMFYRMGQKTGRKTPVVSAHPLGWRLQGGPGIVQRIGRMIQQGTIPSVRPFAEKGEPYTFHQRGVMRRVPNRRTSTVSAITRKAPEAQKRVPTKKNKLPAPAFARSNKMPKNESYDFTF